MSSTEMASSSGLGTGSCRVMERPNQEQILQQKQALRCPRCDSTNTKFCYYNNYSLSQPRHFCKSCKRYWTRGGNLRNVPVGGGCRKNKRGVKRHGLPPAVVVAGGGGGGGAVLQITGSTGSPAVVSSAAAVGPNFDRYSTTAMNSLFYGLHPATSGGAGAGAGGEVSFPFSTTRYDHLDLQPHHQLGSLGIGFSSGILNNGGGGGGGMGSEYRNGLMSASSPKSIIHNLISSNSSLLNSNYNTFGSSSSSSSSSSSCSSSSSSSCSSSCSSSSSTAAITLSSISCNLLPSRPDQRIPHQQRYSLAAGGMNIIHKDTFLPYEEGLDQMRGSTGLGGMFLKLENGRYRGLDGAAAGHGGSQNQLGKGDETGLVGSSSADPSLFWNGTSISSWLDPCNTIGSSSIPSLI